MYYTYMIRCSDNSLYTGITNDLQRRVREHINKEKKCAKYTFNHDAIRLECAWVSNNRSVASRLEYYIKKLRKKDKEFLVLFDDFSVFLDKVDSSLYKRVGDL